MCGLCLPVCPTYAIAREEGESPRGRISLIQAYHLGQLEPSEKLFGHLDRCLLCRACESACPSQVPFAKIMDVARDSLEKHRSRSAIGRLKRNMGLKLVRQPRLMKLAGRALDLYLRLPAQSLRPLPAHLAEQAKTLPTWHPPRLAVAGPRAGYIPPLGKKIADIALFKGCVNGVLDGSTQDAAIELIRSLGYGIYLPRNQDCCGAMHQHNGASGMAAELAQANLSAFGSVPVKQIVFLATGCGIQLLDYPRVVATDDKTAAQAYRFSDKCVDICEFLALAEGWERIQLKRLEKEVAVHEPCSHRNVLGGTDHIYALAKMVPGITAVPLQDNETCCGSAGTYLLSQPEISTMLLTRKVDAIEECGCRIILSTNVGCALHMKTGCPEGVEVLHPVELVARQLPPAI